jgi:hypothetical protein
MSKHIPRREFLKTVPAAATVIAYGGAQTSKPENVRIGTTSFTPIPDYPIRPKPGADVRIRDNFWKPKITTNARVTIPLEIQKMTQAERNFSNNVLEAAILTLKDSPDPVLEAQVERQVRSMAVKRRAGIPASKLRRRSTIRPAGAISWILPLKPLLRFTTISNSKTRRFQEASATRSTASSFTARRTIKGISSWPSITSTFAVWRIRSTVVATINPISRCWSRAKR